MKIIEFKSQEDKTKIDIVDFFHRFAKANGSTDKIDLEIRESVTSSNVEITCYKNYSNRQFTKGYFALLYAIDTFAPEDVAFTSPSSKNWFCINVRVDSKLKLVNSLS